MAARNLVYSLKRKQESGLRESNRRLAVAFPEVLQPFRCVSHPSRYMVLTIPGVATLRRDPDQRALGDAETADAALAASGDATAFERLYRTHVARVHSLVRRMLDVDEADDVTQDVFFRAWQKLSTFGGERGVGKTEERRRRTGAVLYGRRAAAGCLRPAAYAGVIAGLRGGTGS